MKVLIMPTAERAATRASGFVVDALNDLQRPVLGLATGSTMEPVYADLVTRYRRGEISFAKASSFNLDEYVGLSPDHPQSYRQTMERLLFGQVDINAEQCFLPQGDAPDPEAEALRYDAEIASAGGIDVQLLGIGRNGHIGFNEPTSSLAGRTRIKTLTRSTREANAHFFDDPAKVPRYAITMGIANIMEASHCVLVATGDAKADAVARMIEGPVGADCPATALQWHTKVTVVLDRAAAAGLRMIDYYLDIHPDGEEPTIV